jgi:thiol-disulfide isomerase/thioredoxin
MTRWIRTFAATALFAAATVAQALTITPYSAPALAAAQQAGQPVAVHFHADWCPTCKQQEKSLAQLKTEPGLDITVLVANYDQEKELRKTMKVRTQSTMVVFKGSEERARLAGDTAPDKIRAALKAGL